MRRIMFVVFGLMIFAGSAGLFFNRQLRPMEAAPSASERAPATRGLGSPADGPTVQRGTRRIDRGLDQYRLPNGGWQTFEAAIDVLNLIVGLVGISLAVSGMRARREASRNT